MGKDAQVIFDRLDIFPTVLLSSINAKGERICLSKILFKLIIVTE